MASSPTSAAAIDVTTKQGRRGHHLHGLAAGLGETPRLLAEPVGELRKATARTVLIVDDERSLVALAEETLAALGWEPVGFDSSRRRVAGVFAPNRSASTSWSPTRRCPISPAWSCARDPAGAPGVPIVLMSGYSGAQLADRAYLPPGGRACCASRSSPATSPSARALFAPGHGCPPKMKRN